MVLFCKQTLLNHLLMTHDPWLRALYIEWKIKLLSNLARKYTGCMIFTAWIVYTAIAADIFTIFNCEKAGCGKSPVNVSELNIILDQLTVL